MIARYVGTSSVSERPVEEMGRCGFENWPIGINQRLEKEENETLTVRSNPRQITGTKIAWLHVKHDGLALLETLPVVGDLTV